MVSSVLWRVQYKHETPNQSLKLKTLNGVSSVLRRVQYKEESLNQSLKFKPYMWSRVLYKHEPPNQSIKLKTLNVSCSMHFQAKWKHQTPNHCPVAMHGMIPPRCSLHSFYVWNLKARLKPEALPGTKQLWSWVPFDLRGCRWSALIGLSWMWWNSVFCGTGGRIMKPGANEGACGYN